MQRNMSNAGKTIDRYIISHPDYSFLFVEVGTEHDECQREEGSRTSCIYDNFSSS